RVMLDDDGRLEIRGGLLEALERRHRLGAIEVERRHAIRIVILAEVRRIAGDHHGPHLRHLDEKALMAGPGPRRPQHDHAAVPEYVLVERKRFDLALALGPVLEWLEVDTLGRLRAGDRVPLTAA